MPIVQSDLCEVCNRERWDCPVTADQYCQLCHRLLTECICPRVVAIPDDFYAHFHIVNNAAAIDEPELVEYDQDTCPYCGELSEYCECERCPDCGDHIEECTCRRARSRFARLGTLPPQRIEPVKQVKQVKQVPEFKRENVLESLAPYEKVLLNTPVHPMLTPVGVEEARFWINSKYGTNWHYTTFADWVGLEDNIQRWTFEHEGEEFQCGGKMISRISKILNVRYGIKMSEGQKADLNSIIQNHWVGGEEFWIDRPDIVDWQSGEFGEKDKKSEDGSCWWYEGGLTNPRSRIGYFNSAMGTLTGAIRLWSKQQDGEFRGVGRVWYIRTREGNPILFNGYGLTTAQWTAKLSKHFGVQRYTKVLLQILPHLIINNNSGYLFDTQNEYVKDEYHFDLRSYAEE